MIDNHMVFPLDFFSVVRFFTTVDLATTRLRVITRPPNSIGARPSAIRLI